MKLYTKLATFFPAYFFGIFCFFGVVVSAAPGDLDPTFGSGGVLETDIPQQGKHLAVQPDGKIIFGGRVEFEGKDVKP